MVLSGSVNGQIGGFDDTLFLHLTSPHWFLYILFFIFLIISTVKTLTGIAVLFGFAVVGKSIQITRGYNVLQIYAVSNLLTNLIWFVMGMLIAFGKLQKYFQRY